MHFQGNIDEISNEYIRGWIVADNSATINLAVDGESVAEITNFHERKDVIKAGITDSNCGFDEEIASYFKDKVGSFEVAIWVNDLPALKSIVRIKSGKILNENPYLALNSQTEITGFEYECNHRIGLSFDRFIAPTGLTHSDGNYTRFLFKDDNNTRTPLTLFPAITDIPNDIESLQVALVGKASHDSNMHIRIIDNESGKIIEDYPAFMERSWQVRIFDLSKEITASLREKNSSIVLVTKHHGKRFIDISMFAIVEDFSSIDLPNQQEVEVNTKVENLIVNGDLKKWSHGIDFSHLKRGQYLADHWLLEYHKSNVGKLSAAVKSDEKAIDPLGASLQSKFGLRLRTAELDGYCRIIIPFDVTKLATCMYTFEMDIEVTGLNKTTLLESVSIIGRDTAKEAKLYTIFKKQVVSGRQLLSFSFESLDIANIIQNAAPWNTLAIALEFGNNQDLTVYGISLLEAEAKEVNNTLKGEESAKENAFFFAFEDNCITEQLSVLKGLDDWINPQSMKADNTKQLSGNERHEVNSFDDIVHLLIPHKLGRPSRDFPIIDIIVPVYNACDDVLLCLSALIEKTDLLHRVIVINDGEDTRTAEMLSAFDNSFSHLQVVTNPQNLGYTKSVNVGVKHSNADWVVVLNSDTIVSEGWLGRLMNCALSTKNVGMVGALSNAASWQSVPKIRDENGDWHLNPLPEGMSVDDFANIVSKHSQRSYPQVGVINGFCQLINMELLDQIGLLDEVAFPVGYGEENDMCARAVKAGFKLLIADDTYVYHAKSKSFGHEKRKVLAKQGSTALKKKHPDVDWGEITKKIFEDPALVTLREDLSKALSK
tara:strand:+ start:2128 stop:4611 length:2484 start_codon:yes stop_codon:yes gene_type:complete